MVDFKDLCGDILYSDEFEPKTAMELAMASAVKETKKVKKINTTLISQEHNELMELGIGAYFDLFRENDVLMLPRPSWHKLEKPIKQYLEETLKVYSPSNFVFSQKEFEANFYNIFSKAHDHYCFYCCTEPHLPQVTSLVYSRLDNKDYSDSLSDNQFKKYSEKINKSWYKSYHVFGSKTRIYNRKRSTTYDC